MKLRTAAEKVVELCSERPLSLGKWFIDMSEACESLREALAEQPAQQEPVATDWERIARVQDAKLRAMCNESGGFEKLCEVMDRYEHTSPQPAQRTWVGLTDEEIDQGLLRTPYAMKTAEAWREGVRWAYHQLKEKNT